MRVGGFDLGRFQFMICYLFAVFGVICSLFDGFCVCLDTAGGFAVLCLCVDGIVDLI